MRKKWFLLAQFSTCPAIFLTSSQYSCSNCFTSERMRTSEWIWAWILRTCWKYSWTSWESRKNSFQPSWDRPVHAQINFYPKETSYSIIHKNSKLLPIPLVFLLFSIMNYLSLLFGIILSLVVAYIGFKIIWDIPRIILEVRIIKFLRKSNSAAVLAKWLKWL